MGRKVDLKKVDRIAREEGIPDELRDEFGDYLHGCKKSGDYGSGPRGDYTDQELREKAKEFLDAAGRSNTGDDA